MNYIEVMKQALEALEHCDGYMRGLPSLGLHGLAITKNSTQPLTLQRRRVNDGRNTY